MDGKVDGCVLCCAAVCCSVLECVAVCCSVLKCVAVNLDLAHLMYRAVQRQRAWVDRKVR